MYEGNTTMYVYFSKFQIPQHFLLPVAPITCSTFSNKIFESFSKATTAFYIHTLLNEQQHTSSVENISTNQPFQYTHDTHTTLHAHYPPPRLGMLMFTPGDYVTGWQVRMDPGKLRSVDVPTPTYTWRILMSMTHTCKEGAYTASSFFLPLSHRMILI